MCDNFSINLLNFETKEKSSSLLLQIGFDQLKRACKCNHQNSFMMSNTWAAIIVTLPPSTLYGYLLSYAETFQRVLASHLTNLTVDCDSRVFSYRNRQIRLIRVLRIFGNLKKFVLVHTYLISKVMTLSFSVLS